MPPKISQQKHNAPSKPRKRAKKSDGKSKVANDPLMVFEFESEEEDVITPLRPRGAVPTPKQLSGQSSDGNDLSDHLADRNNSPLEGNKREEEDESEPEDVLAGLVKEPSPSALSRKRAGAKPRGGRTRGGYKRVKSGDAADLATKPSEKSAPSYSAATQESIAHGPVFSDPLGEDGGYTPPAKPHPPSKRGRKAPGSSNPQPQLTPPSGEVKRKRGRPRKNPLPPPPTSPSPSPPPPTSQSPSPPPPASQSPSPPPPISQSPSPPPSSSSQLALPSPSKPLQSLLQASPSSSSPTPLVAVEAALMEGHPLSESPVQVEVHDSEEGVARNHQPPGSAASATSEVVVVKRKRGRPRKTPLPPPPPAPPAEAQPSEDACDGVKSPVHKRGVSDEVHSRGTMPGGVSDVESPLAGIAGYESRNSANESSWSDTPSSGNKTAIEHEVAEIGSVKDVLAESAATKDTVHRDVPSQDLSSGGTPSRTYPGVDVPSSGTSAASCDISGIKSCDTAAPLGDSSDASDAGSKPAITESNTSHLEMEVIINEGTSNQNTPDTLQPDNVKEISEGDGVGAEDEKLGDITTEEELEEEEEKVEEPRPNRFTRAAGKATTSFSVTKSAADVSAPAMARSYTWPARGGNTQGEKGLVTVVRNVKQAHECQLLGDIQQHIDELYYLLDSIGPTQSLCVRSLATCSLAQQCLSNEFRQVIKEKKLLTKMFARLKDGTGDPGIRLAITVLAYVLSRDKLNHDWNAEVADLLVSVMSLERKEVDGEEVVATGKDSKDYLRVLTKARKVLESSCNMEMAVKDVKDQKPGDQYKINEHDISVPELACEVFLTISLPQNNCQWLREELRASGGLDLISNMIIGGCNFVEQSLKSRTGEEEDTKLKRRLNEMERQLKCLENATFMNKTNQSYLVVFDGSILVSKLTKLLLACETMMDNEPLRRPAQDCLVSVTKLLLNLTHDNELGSCRLGEQTGLLGAVLEIIFKLPSYIAEEEQFDLLVLGLGLLINLTELSAPNRQQLETLSINRDTPTEGLPARSYPFLGPLAQLFLKHHSKVVQTTIDVPTPQRLSQLTSQESPAKSSQTSQPTTTFSERLKQLKMAKKTPKVEVKEAGTDLEGSAEEKADTEECESSVHIDPLVFSREDFDNALSQAGKHMEDSILAAYAALLLGILAKHHYDCVDHVKNEMPSKSFAEMLEDLHRFVSFMSMTGAPAGLESVRHIIKYLEVV